MLEQTIRLDGSVCLENQNPNEDREGTTVDEEAQGEICAADQVSPNVEHGSDTPARSATAPTFERGGNTGCPDDTVTSSPLTYSWARLARRKDIWRRILFAVLKNPVIWGIVGGFALSLSTVGPRFLNPTSPEFVPGLGWFFQVTKWFSDIVYPLSLFAMGIWMQKEGIFNLCARKIPVHITVLSMVGKLVLVPLVMVGLAKACRLTNEAGRAAVLIASLPISMASFSLASHYKIGEAVLSANVAVGTARK